MLLTVATLGLTTLGLAESVARRELGHGAELALDLRFVARFEGLGYETGMVPSADARSSGSSASSTISRWPCERRDRHRHPDATAHELSRASTPVRSPRWEASSEP